MLITSEYFRGKYFWGNAVKNGKVLAGAVTLLKAHLQVTTTPTLLRDYLPGLRYFLFIRSRTILSSNGTE